MNNKSIQNSGCENPDISIIVPVYNTEKYLHRCLDSLINQTHNNIEIICVNDGSNDSSADILEKYQFSDKRIKIITQVNMGLSGARNSGLTVAKAPYIMFVDSDDYIELNACANLYNVILKTMTDVVMYCHFLEYEDKKLPQKILGDKQIIFNYDECRNYILRRMIGLCGKELRFPEQQDKLSSACTKIYRKQILYDNNIRFVSNDIVGPCEDALFNMQFFSHTNKCAYVPYLLYHYVRTNEASITSNYRRELQEKFNSFYKAIYENIILSNEAVEIRKKFEEALANRYVLSIIPLGINETRSNESYVNKVKRIKGLIKRPMYLASIKKCDLSNMKIHWKMFFFFVENKMNFCAMILLSIMEYIRCLRKKRG